MYGNLLKYRSKLIGRISFVINLCQEKSSHNVCPNPDDGKLKRWESHACMGRLKVIGKLPPTSIGMQKCLRCPRPPRTRVMCAAAWIIHSKRHSRPIRIVYKGRVWQNKEYDGYDVVVSKHLAGAVLSTLSVGYKLVSALSL